MNIRISQSLLSVRKDEIAGCILLQGTLEADNKPFLAMDCVLSLGSRSSVSCAKLVRCSVLHAFIINATNPTKSKLFTRICKHIAGNNINENRLFFVETMHVRLMT